MAYRTPARLALLSLIALMGACSTIKSYLPNSGGNSSAETTPSAQTDSSAQEYALPRTAASQPRPRPRAVSQTYVTESDINPMSVPIKPGAPQRYTVVRGDTLWDISGMYLEDPWLWPEIWHVNPQIENPHLIYPGDILSLVWIDGRPQLRLERDPVSADVRLSPEVRYRSLEDSIKTIPYDAIASFLSKPTIVDKKTARNAPYILGIRESHLIAGSGFHVFVRGTDAPPGTRFRIYHIGDELYDPDDGHLLGYEGLYVGEGRITDTAEVSTMFLTETRREALKGDRLILEEPNLPLNFYPRAAPQGVEGKIVSVVDGVSLIGNYQIVSMNLGANHGIEPGHVLSVFQAGEVVHDRYMQNGGFRSMFKGDFRNAFKSRKVELPETHAGELMIFRVADEISYGLIMHATSEIRILDTVREPI